MKGALMDRFLPRPIDNNYRGSRIALWLFGLVVAVTLVQGFGVIFNGHATLVGADGIPLDTYPPDAVQTILALWALRGLSRVIICLLCLLALGRYRSAVPFMFVLLMVNYLAGQLIFQFIPVVRTGTPPGPIVNLAMFALMVVGFVLSLRGRTLSA
jgi:hypothetical protein